MNRKQYAIEQAAIATAIDAARDLGREHFRATPQDLLVAVARYGALLFPDGNSARQVAFLQGYIEARAHHDAFKRGE